MKKEGKIFISIALIILILFVFQTQIISSEENNDSILSAFLGERGGEIPILSTELSNQEKIYNIKPSRIKFELDEKPYAIQLRRVKQNYAEFLILSLDAEKPDDKTAYTIEDSFNLSINGIKEVDVNKDGIDDVLIRLNEIGRIDKIRSANFIIKKIEV